LKIISSSLFRYAP